MGTGTWKIVGMNVSWRITLGSLAVRGNRSFDDSLPGLPPLDETSKKIYRDETRGMLTPHIDPCSSSKNK